MDAVLDTKEAAAKLRLSVQTLRTWRMTGRGPDYVKAGKRVLYTVAALESYLAANTVGISGAKS